MESSEISETQTLAYLLWDRGSDSIWSKPMSQRTASTNRVRVNITSGKLHSFKKGAQDLPLNNLSSGYRKFYMLANEFASRSLGSKHM